MLKRLPLIPTLLVLIAVAVMMRLGFWQIDRMHQKEALLSEFETALKTPGTAIDLNRDQLIDYPAAFSPISVACMGSGPDAPKSGRNLAGQAGWAHVFDCTYRGPGGRQATVKVIGGWSQAPVVATWQGGAVSGIVAPESMTERQKWHIIANPPLAGLEANARPNPADIPNNHWSYAIQWFLFAGVALVIYGLAVAKRLAAKDAEG
jgi:surfeit locus 1 family protein